MCEKIFSLPLDNIFTSTVVRDFTSQNEIDMKSQDIQVAKLIPKFRASS